jgi:hypothetical protein
MPDGAIEFIAPGELLWFRKAFSDEFANMTMLRVASGGCSVWGA